MFCTFFWHLCIRSFILNDVTRAGVFLIVHVLLFAASAYVFRIDVECLRVHAGVRSARAPGR